MNQVFLTGHVGQDPQTKTFDGGRKVQSFTLATSRRYKAADGTYKDTPTQWHNVQAWGYLADIPVKKGSMVTVVGEITYRKYQDDKGIDRYITDIVATEMHVIQKYVRSSAPEITADNDPVLKYNDGLDKDGFTKPKEMPAEFFKSDIQPEAKT